MKLISLGFSHPIVRPLADSGCSVDSKEYGAATLRPWVAKECMFGLKSSQAGFPTDRQGPFIHEPDSIPRPLAIDLLTQYR